uniref:CWC15 spliceosome associated protein homolog n=1 Tax=Takifugu rubripes TaxID=31033 RepID=H2URU1_TAKRU
MTTAARPTFDALSKQYSSRDLPGHTKIKYRQPTQDAPEEVRARDFRRELEERERAAAREKNTREGTKRLHTTSSSSSSSSKRPRLDQIPAVNLDADDPLTDEDEDEDSGEESEDDAALQINTLVYVSRWDHDVFVQELCQRSRRGTERERFVNDTLRSEFHKKFMEKYVNKGLCKPFYFIVLAFS